MCPEIAGKLRLFLFWTQCKGQEGSPLIPWLFGSKFIGESISLLNEQALIGNLERYKKLINLENTLPHQL